MNLEETAKPEWWTDPTNVGELFLMLLIAGQLKDLEDFITPESEVFWGDFSDAQAFVNSITDLAIVRPAQIHSLADDVAHLGLLNSSVAYSPDEESIVLASGFVTLVWRYEFERWMVSCLGMNREPLELIARSEPG